MKPISLRIAQDAELKVIKALYGVDYPISQVEYEKWYQGSSPVANEINPDTNKPFHSNGDSNPSFQIIFKKSTNGITYLNFNDFTDPERKYASLMRDKMMSILEPLGCIAKRKSGEHKNLKNQSEQEYNQMEVPEKPKKNIVTTRQEVVDITNKFDNEKFSNYIKTLKGWRCCPRCLDEPETEKNKKWRKLPATSNSTWMSPQSYYEIKSILAQTDSSKIYSKRALSFSNAGLEVPVICIDIDGDKNNPQKVNQNIDKIKIPAGYGFKSDDIDFAGAYISQSGEGIHIGIKLKTIEAWKKVITVGGTEAQNKKIYECYPNNSDAEIKGKKLGRHIISVAHYNEDSYKEKTITFKSVEMVESVSTVKKSRELLSEYYKDKIPEEIIICDKEVKKFDLTQEGNLHRFAYYAEGLCKSLGGNSNTPDYCYFTGKVWSTRVEDVEKVYTLARQALVMVKFEYWLHAETVEPEKLESFNKFYMKFYNNNLTIGAIQNVLKLARSFNGMQISRNAFDIAPSFKTNRKYLFNCQNGTLNFDYKDGVEFTDFRSDDYLTLLSDVNFDPKYYNVDGEYCPNWCKFIRSVCCEKPEDKYHDLSSYLELNFASWLLGEPKTQNFLLIIGNGADGKSTLVGTLQSIFGKYMSQPSSNFIVEETQKTAGCASPELLDLKTKRVVVVGETDQCAKLDVAKIKKLTGGDDYITARNLYSNEMISYKPQFGLMMVTNQEPVVRDDSNGFFRRVKYIRFNLKLKSNEIDYGLGEKLRAERDAIFGRMVYICREIYMEDFFGKENIPEPECIQLANQSLREDSDSVGTFLVKNYDISRDQIDIPIKDIYDKYCRYSQGLGEEDCIDSRESMSHSLFTRILKKKGRAMGFTIVHKNSGSHVRGLSKKDLILN